MLNIKVHIYSKAKRGFSFLDDHSKLRELTSTFQCILLSFLWSSPTDSLFPESSRTSFWELLWSGVNNSYSWNSRSYKLETLGTTKISLMGVPSIAVFRFRCSDTKAQEPSSVTVPLSVLPWNLFPWKKMDFGYCLQYKYFIAMRTWAQI